MRKTKIEKKEERWERKLTKKEQAKFKNIKKIELAPQDRVKPLQKYIDIILKALGHPEALVTDESRISDFLSCFIVEEKVRDKEFEKFKKSIKKLGFEISVDRDDLLVEVARKIKWQKLERNN